ncbi:hypothetical protein ACQZV8_00685 [Magnetococcales bacterium HHB-1]
MSTISGIGNFTGEVGKPSEQVLEAIKEKSSKTAQSLRGKMVEGSQKVSDRTEGFSDDALKVTVSKVPAEQGRAFPTPQSNAET